MVPGTENAHAPFWSPDNQQVGFASQLERKLKVVAASGGEARVVCDYARALEPTTFAGASWSRDGVILFASAGTLSRPPQTGRGVTLHRVPAEGGVPIALDFADRAVGETGHLWPQFLPDGRRFLFLAWSDSQPSARAIFVGSLDSSDRTLLMPADSMAMYVPPGYLLFTRQGRLLAQRFITSALELSGEPAPLGENLLHSPSGDRGAFSASEETLAYRTATGDTDRFALSWIERSGKASAPFGSFDTPLIRLSPDGKRVALSNGRLDVDVDIWVYDIVHDQKTLLASDPVLEHWPVWSPDGSRIGFDSGLPNTPEHVIYEQLVDQADPPRVLLPHEPGFGYGLLDWTAEYHSV